VESLKPGIWREDRINEARCSVSFPESRPDKIRENKNKSLNLMAYEKIKIYRNTDCEYSQKV
jgi:hypothetical protein